MLPDQMPRQPFEGTLEPLDAAMSNDELAAAIKYAFECCAQAYIAGSPSEKTDIGKLMLAHLQALTAVQAARAQMWHVPPNA